MTEYKPNNDETNGPEDFGREVLFEVVPVGNALRVTAIDVETGVEATIIAASNITRYSLKANAMRKLAHVLSKLSEDDPLDPTKSTGKPGRYA